MRLQQNELLLLAYLSYRFFLTDEQVFKYLILISGGYSFAINLDNITHSLSCIPRLVERPVEYPCRPAKLAKENAYKPLNEQVFK